MHEVIDLCLPLVQDRERLQPIGLVDRVRRGISNICVRSNECCGVPMWCLTGIPAASVSGGSPAGPHIVDVAVPAIASNPRAELCIGVTNA